MTATYVYSTGDRLAERAVYSYSAYQGAPFLAAWHAARASVEGIAGALPPASRIELPAAGSPVETSDLLEALLFRLEQGVRPKSDVVVWLGLLVKKYEVTKRVHRGYGANFLAVDREDHCDLALYLRLAEVFDLALSVTGDMQFLNVLLKVMDTLVSVADRLDAGQRQRLSRLIIAERAHVGRVAAEVGVAT